MTPLTLAELRARHAQLNMSAERKREEWRRLPATPRSIEMGKQIRALDERAAEYAALIRVAEGMEP